MGATGGEVLAQDALNAVPGQNLLAGVRTQVDAAVLAESDRDRDAALDAGEALVRTLVAQDPGSAEAHYWLAAVLGIRAENAGGLGKLALGREVFRVSARVLELDSLYAGGHELMGRVHANIQRLPWMARRMALRGGLAETVGASSWEVSMAYFRRAMELDPEAPAPRFELAKIYLERGRRAEGRALLEGLLSLDLSAPVEMRMAREIRDLLGGTAGGCG